MPPQFKIYFLHKSRKPVSNYYELVASGSGRRINTNFSPGEVVYRELKGATKTVVVTDQHKRILHAGKMVNGVPKSVRVQSSMKKRSSRSQRKRRSTSTKRSSRSQRKRKSRR